MSKQRSWARKLILPLLGFGVLCLLTSFFLGFVASDKILSDYVPASGGIIGPFTIEEGGTVLDVTVSQQLPMQTWSFVSIALLDEDKQWLIGFGGEFWHEEGYDDGYYWNQADSQYQATVTVPEDGRYYLQIKPDTDMQPAQVADSTIFVEATTRGFSTIPHFAAGILAIIAAFGLLFFGVGLNGDLMRVLKEE